jgi:cytochrome c2
MAEGLEPEKNSEGLEPDPIVDMSLSTPMLICTALMFLSLVWSLWDELITTRPWKGYQDQFVKSYTAYLKKLGPRQAAAEKAVYASPEFQKIDQQLKAAEQVAAPKVTEIEHQLRNIRQRLAVIKDPFQDARAKIAALTYELDHTGRTSGKDSVRKEIEDVRKRTFRVAFNPNDGLPAVQGGSVTFDEMERLFVDLKSRESQLVAQQAEVTKEARDLRKQRNDYISDHLMGLNQQQIDGLLRKMETFSVEIKQIHVQEADLVDRCESCHLGVREPLTLAAADVGGKQLFVSHPDKALLSIHDPDRFGCSPCHNGNGLAVSSVEKAHGTNEHWLWPMFAKENSEAGCVQCHLGDRVLEHAPTLVRGQDLFQVKGCVGCHRFEAFDREMDALSGVRKEIQNLELQQKDTRLQAGQEVKLGDAAESNEEAQKHFARAENLRVTASNMDARLGELEQRSKYLMQDQKKVAPNLKDARLKLRKEWIPVWLKDPQAFRPGTKMPSFRLSEQEIRAISAFVWQSGLDGPKLASQPQGDAAKGKELLETRGCLGCHSIGEGSSRMGDEFAANLSRLGEKANYDYIVRWVHNPRERTRPYCPRERRDLGPEDYAKNGQPYVFDLEHSTCPNDGAQLQVQNMTVMPSQRLSLEEARDIATYLTGLKHNDATYPQDVSYMDDTKLAESGRQLIDRYGCASCHEIRGLEDAARIGTELTKEASKPIEQLDFGLLEPKAEKENWYNHKGFFEHKLENPAVFDQGREKAPEDKLRMPKIQLTSADIRALTTFLLGSIDTPYQGEFRTIPEQFRYIPTDRQRDIQEGWWIVKKYNCMGCHTVQVGQKSTLSTLARYQDPDWKDQLPPSLVQEGARVNPEWLTRFLANPAMNENDTDRNGVRTYLKARMPTFNFSPNELGALVRFFGAMASQPEPYIPVKVKLLDEREREVARTLFSSRAAPCLKCHLVGEPKHDRFATAPNFLMARERLKPAWMARWMLDPQAISPGTPMPSGLFRRDGEHWVFNGVAPEAYKGYAKDQVELLVRYMLQLTAEEQHRLSGMLPTTSGANAGGPGSATRAEISQR